MKLKCAVTNEEWTINYISPTAWVSLINEHAGHEWKCSVCGNDIYVRTEGENDDVITEVYCSYCRTIYKPM